MRIFRNLMTLVFALTLLAAPAALGQMPNGYGAPIRLDVARRVASAAIAEGKKNGWTVAVAIVDPGGALAYFERLDGTQAGSSEVALAKARSAVAFKRPTKAFEDAVAGGRHAILSLPGAMPLEGGIPLVDGGQIIGAIGVSGVTSEQDGVCAKAGAAVLGAPAKPAKKN